MQSEQQDSILQGGQRNDFRNDSHLPECLTPMYNAEAWCICDRLQACEARVLGDRDEIVGLTAVRSFRAGLEAAREAVAKEAERGPLYSVRNSDDAQRGWDAMSRHALAAIDALRDQPADQTGYGVPNVRRLAADLIEEYAEARHQPHTPRYDCGRCDLTAALRAASHDIRNSS